MKFQVIVDLRVEKKEFVVSQENLLSFIERYRSATLIFRELPIEFNPNIENYDSREKE
jgi:hypothetical protein